MRILIGQSLIYYRGKRFRFSKSSYVIENWLLVLSTLAVCLFVAILLEEITVFSPENIVFFHDPI